MLIIFIDNYKLNEFSQEKCVLHRLMWHCEFIADAHNGSDIFYALQCYLICLVIPYCQSSLARDQRETDRPGTEAFLFNKTNLLCLPYFRFVELPISLKDVRFDSSLVTTQ